MLTTEPPRNSHHLHFKSGKAEVTGVNTGQGCGTHGSIQMLLFLIKGSQQPGVTAARCLRTVQTLGPGDVQGLGSARPQALRGPV